MITPKNSNVNPAQWSEVRSPKNKINMKVHEELHSTCSERLGVWTEFVRSGKGVQALGAIIHPLISKFERSLTLSVRDYAVMGYTVEQAMQIMAEDRGALNVLRLLAAEPETLQKNLEDLEKLLKEDSVKTTDQQG